MIHPTDTKIPSNFSSLKAETEAVQVEKNIFGYAINAVLATGWFLLFINIFVTPFIDDDKPYNADGWKVLEFQKLIDPIPRTIFALASLLLGGFHVYILQYKNKKPSDGLKTRIISSWPLILGTILYIVAVVYFYITCWMSAMVITVAGLSRKSQLVHLEKFSLQYPFAFLAVLFVPLTVCAGLLFEDSVSNVFSPWTVKNTVRETDMAEHKNPVYGCSYVGFLVSFILAFIWLSLASFAGLYLCFGFFKQVYVIITTFFLIYICGLVICGVHLYTLCTPKYDSGDASDGYINKNWLIVSSCSVVSLTCVVLTISAYIEDIDYEFFINATLVVIILSLCSCAVLVPSNSSRSCTGCFKPWNTLKKTEVSV